MKHSDSADLQGDAFTLAHPGGEMTVDLVEINQNRRGERESSAFSLICEAAAVPLLPQSIYALSHPALGTFEKFIVPVAQFGDSVQYEALFT
ncbi:DUF6916 family protein [Anianabacter salinae]|uniref:DUF6916 family protein n=1 Tax=Anianabacter salinae TaxID=2851023 RepID=UPI00225E5897|nr:hypothetical protein [Anianabacter salinae]MBV0910749.1 hypothetical protein [Anianabacter salinae]